MDKFKKFVTYIGLIAISLGLMIILGWAWLTLVLSDQMGFFWGNVFFFAWFYATVKIHIPNFGELDENATPWVILSFLALCAFCTLIS